jgi:hypothetical protein
MAIAAGDYVACHRVSTEYTRGFQAQPILFGVCHNVFGGDRDIVWGNGRTDNNIIESALDEIVLPLSTEHVGKVVQLDINPDAELSPSASYDATVLARYRRDLEASGTFTPDLVYCKLLNAEIWFEVDASVVSALDDR